MSISGISGSPAASIDNVLAQLRAAQARAQSPLAGGASAPNPNGLGGGIGGTGSPLRGTLSLSADNAVQGVSGTGTGSFISALKSSLDQVSSAQMQATQLGQAFEKGTGNVDLNDVMVSLQKANVSFQGAVQVRNRMVSAYHDIMNMQI